MGEKDENSMAKRTSGTAARKDDQDRRPSTASIPLRPRARFGFVFGTGTGHWRSLITAKALALGQTCGWPASKSRRQPTPPCCKKNFASLNQLSNFEHKAKESQEVEKRRDAHQASKRRKDGAIHLVGARQPRHRMRLQQCRSLHGPIGSPFRFFKLGIGLVGRGALQVGEESTPAIHNIIFYI
jgi:hypothetical protein